MDYKNITNSQLGHTIILLVTRPTYHQGLLVQPLLNFPSGHLPFGDELQCQLSSGEHYLEIAFEYCILELGVVKFTWQHRVDVTMRSSKMNNLLSNLTKGTLLEKVEAQHPSIAVVGRVNRPKVTEVASGEWSVGN
jgi:hypothetical protein